VPSYEQWQSLNELLDSMRDTNKVLAHKLNNIKVNGNYPDKISKLKSRIKGLTEELEPFTDPYFRGLTTKDIAELAKKSIRLTTQHCEDNARIEKLEELLKECRDFVELINIIDGGKPDLLTKINEALK
jgi:predicted RNase H-like nuclease (RuvC/YqgF family)